MIRKLCMIFALLISVNSYSADIYVSPKGNDRGTGSKDDPLASLHAAIRQVRELRRLQLVVKDEPVNVWLNDGVYNVYEPVYIRPEDSGTLTSPTIIQAMAGTTPSLSGGVEVKGWSKKGKYWVAEAPRFNGNRLQFRQMWVNGEKAVRARNVVDFNDMDRILSNDKVNQILWVPAQAVRKVSKAKNLELVIHQMWAIANLRVKDIIFQGDSAGIKFHNPEARIQFEHPWPQPMVKEGFNSAFYLTNALELVDQPGEWFHDIDANLIYYMPRKGEKIASSEFIVPAVETLVHIEGTLERPVEHVCFKGIGFNYTTWIRPSLFGHVPLQAGMFLLDGYKLSKPGVPGNFNKGIENQGWVGRPTAAVLVRMAKHTRIEECRFEHLGSCGLDIEYGSKYDLIKGNVFRDIAGNALQIGMMSEFSMETHLPYDPDDKRVLCTHQTISNNYITDVTNEDWGCVAICVGYVQDINIEHNEISEISYSGISLGWGWTKTVNSMKNNRVHANYIHHYAKHMYDVAGIYTLSVQSKSSITENAVEEIYEPNYVHDPNHWFYLYTDEGTSFVEVKDNWCPSEKFLKNANGPGNTWTNNGPMVSKEIKERAGLEDSYKWIKK